MQLSNTWLFKVIQLVKWSRDCCCSFIRIIDSLDTLDSKLIRMHYYIYYYFYYNSNFSLLVASEDLQILKAIIYKYIQAYILRNFLFYGTHDFNSFLVFSLTVISQFASKPGLFCEINSSSNFIAFKSWFYKHHWHLWVCSCDRNMNNPNKTRTSSE